MNLGSLIEQNRKGNFSIDCIGATQGTKVTYTLSRLNFELGTVLYRSYFMLPEANGDRRNYLLHIDEYFNTVLIPIFWQVTEPEPDMYADQPYISITDWCRVRQKKTLGHAIFYGWDGLDDADPADAHLHFVQPWVKALGRDDLEKAMKRRLRHVLTVFEDRISEYTLNNEVLGKESLEPGDYYSNVLGFKTLEPYFRWANEIGSSATFYLNENSILAGNKTPQYVEMIRSLTDAGVQVGGIGIQGHFFGKTIPGDEEMWEKLEALSQFHLPVRITEFGIQATDERQYAADLERFYRLCFAHPAVVGITRWGIWEPEMFPRSKELQAHYGWRKEAHLWRNNWSPTPAAEAYEHLVKNDWVTKGSGEIDAQGHFQFRGFFGTYELEVDGSRYTAEFTSDKQKITIAPSSVDKANGPD
ncbi:MAG: endo-1,4-beta-xylanase [Lentisphaeria bacterium]